ncbi:MAG: GGDEF domain-containing protein [Pararhodobacter sp.]
MNDIDQPMPCVTLDPAALGLLMPMFIWLDPTCRIRDAGPTLRKIVRKPFIGAFLTSILLPRRPALIRNADDLTRANRIRLAFADPPWTGFKGVAVPIPEGQGVLINLSFGYGVREAVRDHGLSDTDFAATDLAIELLYLAEAKNAVMAELDQMNRRLLGAKQQAELQAMTDTLTGLGNRRALDQALSRSISAAQPFGLVLLDLDHFKAVNDTLGHAAGDTVLMHVAQALRDSVRSGDLVARTGGDEFVILLHGIVDFAPIRRIAMNLLARLQQPALYRGQPCRVSASLGAVLQHPASEGKTADKLLAEADRALYLSKNAGRSKLTMIDASGRITTIPGDLTLSGDCINGACAAAGQNNAELPGRGGGAPAPRTNGRTG